MANKPDEFKTWTSFSYIEMRAKQREFYDYYHDVFMLFQNLREEDAMFDRAVLAEIIERVEKRRVYFRIYYSKTQPCDMSELNTIALYCYWIAKLKPFYMAGTPSINEKIAVYYFFHRLDQYITAENARNPAVQARLQISPRIVEVLSYDLRYREMSKEALMTLAEALVEYTPA
jgi:hypothetical protein